MMRRAYCLGLLALAVPALAPSVHAASAETPTYKVARSLPGPDGRWDYASFDPASGHVLVAHGNDVLIFDPDTSGAPRSIGAFAGAHAALAIPNSTSILVSNGHDDSVRIVDAVSGVESKKIAVGKDPDAAVIDAASGKAFVMNAKDGTVSVIDLAAGTESGRIALKPGLEAAALISSDMLAVNNEDQNEIELVDLKSNKAAGAIALGGCTEPSGIAYDPQSGLALSACSNGKAALVNVKNRRLVTLFQIGEKPDTALFDARRQLFLIPCGKSGELDLFRVSSTGKVSALPPVTTEISARTAALDPASGRVFLPAARFQPAQAGARAVAEPGSFHLLVMAPVN
ncbi:MAG TPA: YncE family protein [Sphingobium sp.]|uniref:YncE family protein n=1 Tax=Sphingobium sp. TaxID=1912891 RepID=UPI002ED5DCA0